MNFRLYRPEDFEPIYAIEEICFHPPHRFSRGYLQRLMKRPLSATWVAEEDGALFGFAIVVWNATSAYIQTIEVLPQMRRQGIGDQLLLRLEESARAANVNAIGLHVAVDNAAAMQLYERHGYQALGREEGYYGEDRDAFVYRKMLS